MVGKKLPIVIWNMKKTNVQVYYLLGSIKQSKSPPLYKRLKEFFKKKVLLQELKSYSCTTDGASSISLKLSPKSLDWDSRASLNTSVFLKSLAPRLYVRTATKQAIICTALPQMQVSLCVRRDKAMRGALMSHMHNIRQPQDCVSQEGKEDKRWDDVTDA